MNKFTFHRGLRLNIDAKEFVVLRRLSDKRLQFENVQDGEILTLSDTEVLAKYAKKEISFVVNQDPDGQPLDKTLAQKIERELSALAEPLINKIKQRLPYVKAVDLIRPLGIAKGRIEQAIKQVAAKTADAEPPSWTTAYRWWRGFISAGRDPRALIPGWNKRGNHNPRYEPEVYTAARKASTKSTSPRIAVRSTTSRRARPASSRMRTASVTRTTGCRYRARSSSARSSGRSTPTTAWSHGTASAPPTSPFACR